MAPVRRIHPPLEGLSAVFLEDLSVFGGPPLQRQIINPPTSFTDFRKAWGNAHNVSHPDSYSIIRANPDSYELPAKRNLKIPEGDDHAYPSLLAYQVH